MVIDLEEEARLRKQGRPATTGEEVDRSFLLTIWGDDPPAFASNAEERAWLFPKIKLGASKRREVIVVNAYDRLRPTRYECRRPAARDEFGYKTYDPRFFVYDNHWGRSIVPKDSEADTHAEVAERNRLYRKEVAMHDGKWSGRIADLYRAQRRLALADDTEGRLRGIAALAAERGTPLGDDVDLLIRARLRKPQIEAVVAHRKAEIALAEELRHSLARWGNPFRVSAHLAYFWRIEGTLLALVRRPRRGDPENAPLAIVTQRRAYRPRWATRASVPLAAERATDLIPFLGNAANEAGRHRIYLLGDDELNSDYYNRNTVRVRRAEAAEAMERIRRRRVDASE